MGMRIRCAKCGCNGIAEWCYKQRLRSIPRDKAVFSREHHVFGKRIPDAQIAEHTRGVRTQLNAGSHDAERISTLQYRGANILALARDRESQSANAGTHDQYFLRHG